MEREAYQWLDKLEAFCRFPSIHLLCFSDARFVRIRAATGGHCLGHTASEFSRRTNSPRTERRAGSGYPGKVILPRGKQLVPSRYPKSVVPAPERESRLLLPANPGEWLTQPTEPTNEPKERNPTILLPCQELRDGPVPPVHCLDDITVDIEEQKPWHSLVICLFIYLSSFILFFFW